MRIAVLLLCCCIALLSACSGQDAAPTPAPVAASPGTPAAAAIEPKIVVQLGHQAPVLAVRWVDGGRHLASLAQDGSIVLWSVADGSILDHARVPLDPALLDGEDALLAFRAFADGPDAGTLAIAYQGTREGAAERACANAHHPGTRWCTYALDLATRTVRADASLPAPAQGARDAALNWPLSPDGRLRPVANHANGVRGLFDLSDENIDFPDPTCTSPQRCRYGVSLLPVSGDGAPRALTGEPRSYFLDADLSPDGLHLLRVEGLVNDTLARVETLDLGNGSGAPAFATQRAYHEVRWLDAAHYLLGSQGYDASNDTEAAMAGFPPALLVDADCARRGDCTQVESRWQMRPLADGGLIALGSLSGGCYRARGRGVFCPLADGHADDGNLTYDPSPTGLAYLARGSRAWKPIALPALSGETITAIEPSPDRKQLAIATRRWDRADAPDAKQQVRVWLLDIDAGKAGAPRRLAERIDPLGKAGKFGDDATIRALSFSADGSRIVFTHAKPLPEGEVATSADLLVVDVDDVAKTRTVAGFARNAVALGDDRVLGLDDGRLLDLDSGREVARIAGAPFARAGWIERSRLAWATTDDGALHFYDAGDGSTQLTLQTFPGNRYFALMPGGRYDSNLGADTALVRWVLPDAPWQSLAAQTFMRDYYEPGLVRRLLDCRASDTCADVFKPLPSIASRNRVLPVTRIVDVRVGRDAGEAVVTVEVREGVDAHAPNGKTRSGVYNPRLFRNGRLVAMQPLQADGIDIDLAQWRKRNAMQAKDGVSRFEFRVPLPTQAGEDAQVFSAYAFNEDRIKGETATRAWTRPAIATPRKRQAYVLAIGIDDYDTPRFRLRFAVADARLMASKLVAIPGYDTHTLVLAGERAADGKRTRIDRHTLVRVFSLLAGTGDRAATLAALQASGIDASMLQPATPDDAVIVSYSGHGWANPQGDFYLIPADGRWPEGATTPDLASVFATADLVAPFQAMQAGEIALVIDACHSAASVADGRFKPGPMGDSGLGQLAYDKGIRILAASQADDVALEDARLGQGLLTYALAVDGLGVGDADLDHDGRIRIDEWLAYAVARLPALAQDARVGRIDNTAAAGAVGSRDIIFDDLPANARARRVQQPVLFDFNPAPSSVVLRGAAR